MDEAIRPAGPYLTFDHAPKVHLRRPWTIEQPCGERHRMIFYLSVRHGDRIVRDEEGSDLPDLEAARQEAIVTARVMMAQAILEGHDISASLSVEIADANGLVVAAVPFTEAVRAVV